ncbi:hypothetical protein Psal006b_00626 [Piscirickettsia salmonis]|uniref:Uncharacterized protein n=1 Tax=Piscirickettsia salmonis TaxID=1238 RepID=A0A1L6TE58_PISSA|nr:hypothetical protein [Piscirickettsia salmonis]AKP72752.1 hypothetical protein PSLF89_628 [Piscirickettsia salmonis LF-89 = ATCC VR-1361]ALB23742.1 hypothetical protein KU39_2566 [Piscirickettsia salmonis]ALY03592.1 hypothetical protein AWE47_12650 [Piscirickettsia salmonis]AMA43157.1 hypothetical protein AWJ11_12880 [Piscirickettsia salmonis]AOS35628.1 hypothetical protein AVM72_10005 [Piscirickettsia salmonis]
MPALRQEQLATLRENLSRYVQHLHEQNTKSSAAESMARSLASDTFLLSRTRNSSLSAAMLVDDGDAFSAEEAPALQNIREAAIASGLKITDLGKKQWHRLDEQANMEAKTTDGFDAATVAQALLAAFQREYKTKQASDAQEVSSAARPPVPSAFDRRGLELSDDASNTEDERDSTASTSTSRQRRQRQRLSTGVRSSEWTMASLREKSSAPPPPSTAAITKHAATEQTQQPAPTPVRRNGEPSVPPPQAQTAAPGAQLTAPSVPLDGSFLKKATQRFRNLTGKDTVTCEFADNQTKLIAKEAGKEIASVKIEQSDKGTSIQHDGKEATRQLAASAAAIALLANPKAKVTIKPIGGKLSDKEMKAECQALLNAGVKHDQLDLTGLSDDLQADIRKIRPQRSQQPGGAQFVVRTPTEPTNAPQPFMRAAEEAATQKAEAATGLVKGTDADFDPSGILRDGM